LDKLLLKEYSPALASPLYVVGLSGPSGLGRVAAQMLISRAKARLFAELYNHHFPDHVIITEDGTCRLLRYEFYESSTSSPHLLVACGDDGITLENTEGGYDVLDELVELGKNYGASRLIAVDAVPNDGGTSIYIAATKTALTRSLESRGARLVRETHLLGPVGIILGMSEFRLLSAVGVFPTLAPEDKIEARAEETLKLIEESFSLSYPS
jgi:proteasome assembly chaperone (PAC2) family protein